MRTIIFRFAFLSLIAVSMPSHCEEWDVAWPGDTVAVSTSPQRFVDATEPSINGGWVSDLSGAATRLSGSGDILARNPLLDFYLPPGNARVLRNLPDGGALFTSMNSSGLLVSRVDAQGNLTWVKRVRSSLSSEHFVADDRGATWWIETDTKLVRKLAPDGDSVFSIAASALGLQSLEAIAVSPEGELALVSGMGGSDGRRIAGARLSSIGQVLSSWTGGAASNRSVPAYASIVLNAQNAFLVSVNQAEQAVLVGFDGQGNARLPAIDINLSSATTIALRRISSGFALTSNDGNSATSRASIRFFDSAGNQGPTQTLDQGTDHRSLVAASDGALWTTNSNASGQPARLYRVSAASVSNIAVSGLLSSNSFVVQAPSADTALVAAGEQIYLVNLSGQVTPKNSDSSKLQAMIRAMATTDEIGNSYVVQRPNVDDESANGATISRIARTGTVSWTAPLSALARFPTGDDAIFDSALIAANTERVCFYNRSSGLLFCHAISNGSLLSSTSLPESGIAVGTEFRSLNLSADNKLLLFDVLDGAKPKLVLDANNLVVTEPAFETYSPNLRNAAGSYLEFGIVQASTIQSIIRRSAANAPAPQQQRSWTFASPITPVTKADGQLAMQLREDGSVLMLTATGGPNELVVLQQLNSDGSFGYRTEIGSSDRQIGMTISAQRILINTFYDTYDPFSGAGPYHLIRSYNIETGAVQWLLNKDSESASDVAFDLQLEADGQHAIWWSVVTSSLIPSPFDLRAERVRLSDGMVVETMERSCAIKPCSIERVRNDAFGSTLLPSINRREGSPFSARVRADQEQLEGAWYQPLTSGQGVILDYLPESRTWFGAWHVSYGGQSTQRSDLQWFTLQGEVSADNSEVTLSIFEAGDGAFDAPPTVTSRYVGSALLRFDGCGSANLRYSFVQNISLTKAIPFHFADGGIPLRLLTPAANCAAIGEPASPLHFSSRNGVASKFSGTWYNPNTSGQGVEVSIRPDIGNGVLFAGWFTFAPAASGATAGKQWFTLQGDLSTAQNSSVTLPIFRTLGGVFDSAGTRNTQQVGEATWLFIDCRTSLLSYRFDDNDLAGSYSGRTGSMPLSRLGSCIAP